MVKSTTQAVAVMGFGNPVRADDGIGIFVIDRLQEMLGAQPNVSLFDMGTSAFEVLYRLEGHQRIILIDAVINSGEPVGTVFRLPASQVEAEIEEDPMVFLHGLKWNQALSYARKMLGDAYPEEVTVYLVAVEDTRFNVGMSAEAKKGGEKVAQTLSAELKEA